MTLEELDATAPIPPAVTPMERRETPTSLFSTRRRGKTRHTLLVEDDVTGTVRYMYFNEEGELVPAEEGF